MTASALLAQMSAHPLFGLALTFCIYAGAVALHARCGRPALLHPVLLSIAGVAAVLTVTGMEYETYFAQSAPLHLALGAFVVLLAVPLTRQSDLLRRASPALLPPLLVGSVAAISSALVVPVAIGSPQPILVTLASKSATAAVSVGISERLGGVAALTAVTVILTGLCGAMFGPPVLRAAGVRDDRAIGFALGIASHAIGTARAFRISETAGAFASVGMILNAILTSALVPLVLR